MTAPIEIYRLGVLEHTEFANPLARAIELITDGTPRAHDWRPIPMKLERDRLRSDFLGMGSLIMRDRVAVRWREVIERYAEMLPLDLDGERIWLVNVTHHVDALDPEQTSPLRLKADGQVLFMGNAAFRPDRLDSSPLFKLSNALRGPAYLSHEFVQMNQAWNFDGFAARLVWDSLNGPVRKQPFQGNRVEPGVRSKAAKRDPNPIATASEARSGPWRLKTPSRAVRQDTQDFVVAGRRRLGLEGSETPEAAVRAVLGYLRQESMNGTKPMLDLHLPPEVGSVFGDAVHRALGWQWMDASAGKERRRVVASPDGSYAVDPYGLVHRGWFESGAASELLLLFNLLVAGELPPRIEGTTQLLG